MWYKNDKLYTEQEIRTEYSNVSFGIPFNPSCYGYEIVFDTPKPEVPATQLAYQDGTEIDTKGNRVIKWSIRDKTEEEIAADIEAAKPVVPNTITMAQCERQLMRLGVRDQVEAAIVAQNGEGLIQWKRETTVRRDHELVQTMIAFLKWTEEQADTYFIEASKIS